MNDKTDIFGDVQDTETPKTQYDPAMQLYLLPERIPWFVAKNVFGKPKEKQDCTKSLYVRFVSWQIDEETAAVYAGTGVATPGTLRNQLVVRYHPIPDGYGDGTMSGRTPCMLQFGQPCSWCAERSKADKRFPRDKQPADYFKRVIAMFKAKDKTLMIGEIYAQEADGSWKTDGKCYAFEFSGFVRNGRTFVQIINDRANDADKRIRIDKKSYAGYVSPVVIKITYTWPMKEGKPDMGQFSTWSSTDATPFPVEAGGPDVSKFSKEWAMEIAKVDPAAWINKGAFATVKAEDVGKWAYDVFSGAVSSESASNVDSADFGGLLGIIAANKAKFDGVVDTTMFSYEMVEPLRAIVKGVLHG